MRGIKPGLSVFIAICLLAGSAIGVTAQEADTTAQGPVEFTVTWAWGPDVRTDTTEGEEGVVMTRGGAWRPGVITGATDPRLEGAVTIAANSNQYLGGPEVWNYAFRIENDSGAWQQLPTYWRDWDGQRQPGATWQRAFVGEEGYERLIAIVVDTWRPEDGVPGTDIQLDGFIVEGELPAVPEPFSEG